MRVLENNVEVARVELDDPGGINPAYRGVPKLGDERLEIQFIEVATAARGCGVGTQVITRSSGATRTGDCLRMARLTDFGHGSDGEPFYDQVRGLQVGPCSSAVTVMGRPVIAVGSRHEVFGAPNATLDLFDTRNSCLPHGAAERQIKVGDQEPDRGRHSTPGNSPIQLS